MSVKSRQAEKPPTRAVRAEASAWIAKLHGPERSADLEEDFRGWLNADPQNARAFEHVTEIWDAIGSVNVGGLPRLAMDDAFDVHPWWSRTRVAVAACSLAAVGIVALLMLAGSRYSTDIGEQRIVSLEDGSRVFLNSATEVDIDIEKSGRRVLLKRGEAFFEVAKDPDRPFKVTAGDRTVTALGTSFVVRYDPDLLTVTLVEGKVSVRGMESFGSPPPSRVGGESFPMASETAAVASLTRGVILQPGERVTYVKDGATKIDKPRADATAAWRRGEVILDDTPLSDAVAEMNRYGHSRLVIDSAQIDDLSVSGIYRTGNNQDFARAVATVYDLEVIAQGDEIHLRGRR